MAFTLSPNKTTITRAGIDMWWIKKSTDAGYFKLGRLYDGKVSYKSYSQKTSKGITKDFGALFEASAKMYSTDKTIVLKTLDKLSQGSFAQQIATVTRDLFGSIGLTNPYFGFTWKFVCDADSDKNRYIEIKALRKVATADVHTVIDQTEVTALDGSVADDLYALAGLTDRTGIHPSGIAKIEIASTYGGSYSSIGEIMNGKLIIELLAEMDSEGIARGYAVKIDCEGESMNATSTELGQLDALSGQAVYAKATLMDGTVVQMGSSSEQQVGITWEFISNKDSTGAKKIKYVGTGIVPISSLDNLFV